MLSSEKQRSIYTYMYGYLNPWHLQLNWKLRSTWKWKFIFHVHVTCTFRCACISTRNMYTGKRLSLITGAVPLLPLITDYRQWLTPQTMHHFLPGKHLSTCNMYTPTCNMHVHVHVHVGVHASQHSVMRWLSSTGTCSYWVISLAVVHKAVRM